MERLLAAAGFARHAMRDPNGAPYWVTGSGQMRPVRFDVRAELVHRAGNDRPYFAITGEIRRTLGRGDRVLRAGAIHDDILHYWPNLAPLVAVHLSDDRGVPMHAAANAAYWAGETKYQGRDVAALARHLRVSESVAGEMIELAAATAGESRAAVWSAVVFDRFGMRDRWLRDAATARLLLREIPTAAAS